MLVPCGRYFPVVLRSMPNGYAKSSASTTVHVTCLADERITFAKSVKSKRFIWGRIAKQVDLIPAT